MRTPKNMTTAIQNKVITDEILGMCAYSCNKRAKNCRDKIREYRQNRAPYKYIQSYKENKARYYSMKEKFLSIVNPICVHTETVSKSFYDDGEYIGEVDVKLYYLFYVVGEYSFHQPIKEVDLPVGLLVEDIHKLTTYGRDIKDLLSADFCNKVLALLESGDYTYTADYSMTE